jgi:hypothetical protein
MAIKTKPMARVFAGSDLAARTTMAVAAGHQADMRLVGKGNATETFRFGGPTGDRGGRRYRLLCRGIFGRGLTANQGKNDQKHTCCTKNSHVNHPVALARIVASSKSA